MVVLKQRLKENFQLKILKKSFDNFPFFLKSAPGPSKSTVHYVHRPSSFTSAVKPWNLTKNCPCTPTTNNHKPNQSNQSKTRWGRNFWNKLFKFTCIWDRRVGVDRYSEKWNPRNTVVQYLSVTCYEARLQSSGRTTKLRRKRVIC